MAKLAGAISVLGEENVALQLRQSGEIETERPLEG